MKEWRILLMNLAAYYDRAISYNEYLNLLGENQSLHQLHYRKFEPDSEQLEKIRQIGSVRVLVITEPWCADSLAMLPVLGKLNELAGTWSIKVALRDENPDLMAKFLTNGARAIPKFLFLDEKGNLLFTWGPRIQTAQEIFETYREAMNAGEIERPEVMKKIRVFYAKNRGQSIVREFIGLFNKN